MSEKKAMVAMSGGVDSSVAALLIKRAGYAAAGVTLKLFNNEDAGVSREKNCCSLTDAEDARRVALGIGIPHYVFNFSREFNEKVIGNFVESYMSGKTPNPCIECNRRIKFAKLIDRALALDFDFVATGHYAKVEFDAPSGRFLLKKGADKRKDQSYVLYCLTQRHLAHTLFPLGGMLKSEIREIAAENGFSNAQKRESQDICFVPNGKYADFIEDRMGTRFLPGDFVSEDGKRLGEHKGLIRYTVGQRKGLGLALPAPLYVKEKDARKNTVVLSPESGLYQKELTASDINLIACAALESPVRVKAKVRYKQEEQQARIEQIGEDRVHVEFDAPQRAISKGQAVVFYDGDTVVGGGTIE